MPIVADAAVAIRGDLSKFANDLRPAETAATNLGTKLKAVLSPGSVGGISGDFGNLATALDRAQREATEALNALSALSRVDLSADEAIRYADAVNDIEAEAQVTASELRQLQAAQPEFDTPELREAANGLDKVQKEANEVGNEFRELAAAKPDATLAKAARESKSLAAGMDTAAKRSEGLMSKLRGVQSVLIGLGLAIGAQQVIGFFGDAIEAASNLGETAAATGQIFGDEATGGLEAWAETAAETFGQSQRQALDAANTFAIFGKSAGLAGDDLVGFSTDLTELASDLASFRNTTPEEAITAIGAALRGESEPIRRYGVLLDEATLRQRALTIGIIDNIKTALTPQQRVLAAQAEIFAQTSDAQGDYARTSEGLANQQRRQAALLEDAMADLGEALLPLALGFTTFAADVLPDIIEGLKGVMEVIIPLGGILAEHADVIIPALVAVMGIHLVKALKGVTLGAKLSGLAMKGMLGPLALVLVAAEGLGAASDAANDFFTELLKGKDAAKAIGKLEDALGDQPFARELASQLQELGVSTEEWAALTEAAGGDVMKAFQAVKDAAGDTDLALQTLTQGGTTMTQTWADAWADAAGSVASSYDTVPDTIEAGNDRIATSIDSSLSSLGPSMRRAVDEALATATEVPEGVSVTLDNGQTVVAASAEELAGLLPAAIKQARRDAVIAALPAPGEIADAILSGKDELKPIREAIADALVNGVSDARARAQAEAILFDGSVARGLKRSGFKEATDEILDNVGTLVDSVLSIEPDLFEAGTKMPPAIARGYLSLRGEVIEAVREVNNDQTLTAGEVAQYLEIKGEEGLAALVRGIESKKPDVVNAQEEINVAVQSQAARLTDAMFGEGLEAGGNYGDGIGSRGNVAEAGGAGRDLANAAKGEMGFNAYPIGSEVAASYLRGFAGGWTTYYYLISGKVDALTNLLGGAGSPMFTIPTKLGTGYGESYVTALSESLTGAKLGDLAASLVPKPMLPGIALSGASLAPVGAVGGNTYNVTTGSHPREKSTVEIAEEMRRAEYLGKLPGGER